MSTPRTWTLAAATALMTGTCAHAAHAGPPGEERATTPSAADAERAEELFQKARALLKKDKLDEACPLFEESQRLDPNGATLLNLADCHEAFGKTGSAWRALHEATLLAEKTRDPSLVDDVGKRRKALRPKLLLLVVRIPPETRAIQGLHVTCDGEDLDATRPTHFRVVDPGLHVVRAHAPGRLPFRAAAALSRTQTLVHVDVTLEEPPPPPPPPPSLVPPALVIGASGVGLAVGAALLVDGVPRPDKTEAAIGATLTIASAFAAIGGVAWLLSRMAQADPKSPPPIQATPVVSPGFVGLGLTGSF